MNESNRPDEPIDPRSPRRSISAAGKLLVAIARNGAPPLDEIARHSRIGKQRLEDCLEGRCPLEPEQQMRLAAALIEIAPEHERKAHTLFAQAQAALRMRDDPGRSHQFYPTNRFP